jgi:hypothetical protein
MKIGWLKIRSGRPSSETLRALLVTLIVALILINFASNGSFDFKALWAMPAEKKSLVEFAPNDGSANIAS